MRGLVAPSRGTEEESMVQQRGETFVAGVAGHGKAVLVRHVGMKTYLFVIVFLFVLTNLPAIGEGIGHSG